jgi:phosphoglycerate dehydrogenase-like enzyme
MRPAAGNAAAHNAIAGLLMLARAFPRRLAAQREHRWEQLRGDLAPADLQHQTILIVGVGAVGTAVARFAQALDMHVIGVRPLPLRSGETVDEMHPPSQLAELLPRAQWLVLACPHTPQTHHLLDAHTLALLPRGAGVINVAHGGLIDEAALIEALESGKVGSAWLEVFEYEPLAAQSPLRTLPNLMLSRHGRSS